MSLSRLNISYITLWLFIFYCYIFPNFMKVSSMNIMYFHDNNAFVISAFRHCLASLPVVFSFPLIPMAVCHVYACIYCSELIKWGSNCALLHSILCMYQVRVCGIVKWSSGHKLRQTACLPFIFSSWYKMHSTKHVRLHLEYAQFHQIHTFLWAMYAK